MTGDQPRQPKDMKGLLKFCFEATKDEDAPDISDPEKILNDMDPERKKWLEEALNSMSVDIVQQLTNGIKTLNSDASDDEKEEVLELLEDWLGNIDMAVNFHKIGGFSSLRKCLNSSSSCIRSGACHLIAEISQNNPYCQEKFLSEEFIESLINQLDNDPDGNCQVKALYAISCISREYPPAIEKFSSLDGWSVILRALQRDNIKLITKSCYFLTSAVVVSEVVSQHLVDMGMVTQLSGILHTDHGPQHEHILSALRSLVTRSQVARDQARSQELGLESLLSQRRLELRDQEEFLECVEHCESLLQLLSPEFIPTDEWQEVQEWQGVPPGCHVKVDLNTGKKLAKIEQVTDR